jgi:hypothetical protein
MKKLLLNIPPYQNSDENFMIYIFSMSYVICYHMVNFELKNTLMHGETKMKKC